MHLNPPCRAEHVGSLLRPDNLFKKRGLVEEGKASPEELTVLAKEAIADVVAMQQAIGLQVITDGEMARESFFDGVFDVLDGMTFMPQRPMSEWKTYMPHISGMIAMGITAAPTFYCSGKIRRTKPFRVSEEFKYLKSIVAPEKVKNIKVTICSPSWFHQRHGSDFTYDLSVYKNDDEYFDDLGAAYRAEFKDLYDAGCRHIQIDDPTFCFFCNDKVLEDIKATDGDPAVLLNSYIKAVNVCTRDRPGDLTVSVHMCRGNYKGGSYFTEGPYDRIAETVFNKLDVDSFFLEYDSERCGDFKALRCFPLNKVAVLGLVTTKSPRLETSAELEARINEAATIMSEGNPDRTKEAALDQLAISTQCGFASVWQGNPLTIDDEKKKLSLVVETASKIWLV